MSATGLVVFGVLFTLFFLVEWRRMRSRRAGDPGWGRAMKETSWRDRRRIANQVRQGKRLDSPREARLAVGMAEEQRRLMGGSMSGASRLRLLLGAILVVLGLVAMEIGVAALGVIILVIGLTSRTHENRLTERLQRAEELNRAQASIEPPRPPQ
jgi:hypothetical protein